MADPTGYVTVEDVKSMLPAECIEGYGDAALQLQIVSSKEMIDGYCRKPFEAEAVPSIVKSVSLDLVRVLLTDITKQSESIGNGDYSYTQNTKAFDQILARLKFVSMEDDTVSGRGKTVKVRVV